MSEVTVQRPAEAVAMVSINRPEVKNAINLSVRSRICDAFLEFQRDRVVRCVIVTGTATVFAAGADLRELDRVGSMDDLWEQAAQMWEAIVRFKRPIIAAVEGLALGGGCELAMAADLVIAGETATFGQPEVNVGLMPGAGGTQRLVRAVGKHRAMKLLLTGALIGAAEAERIGLISEVVPKGQALERAMRLAEKLASNAPLAVEQIKELVNSGIDMPLPQALRYERKAFQLLLGTRDKEEGIRAFLEKRQPRFEGK